MKKIVPFLLVMALTTLSIAAPPNQADLKRNQLARLKPDERSSLDQRLEAGFYGFGTDGTPLAGNRDQIETFDGKVVIIQHWSMKDPRSTRSIEQLHRSLADEQDVLIIALHPPEDLAKVQRVLDRISLPEVVVLDESGKLTEQLALEARGTNVIIDRVGTIRYTGIMPNAIPDLVAELAQEDPRDLNPAELTLEQLTQQLAEGKKLEDQINSAWQSGDALAAQDLLQQLWQSAPAAAVEPTMGLLNARDPIQKPLAVGLLTQFGSPKDIRSAIAQLDPRRNSPEIAILVRALGDPDLEQPEVVLEPFLNARDLYIQQAAIYALADSADPSALEPFLRTMSNAPVMTDSWSTSDRDRLLNAKFGAAYKITNLRAATARDIEDWINLYHQDPKQAIKAAAESTTGADGSPKRVRLTNEWAWAYPGFDLVIRSNSTNNQLPDPSIPAVLQSSIKSTTQKARSVLGLVYTSPIRVYLADDQGFASLASNSYMGGQARVNSLILRQGDPAALAAVMRHEWAHILHQALFDKTPRWLAEGFAQSVESDVHPLDMPHLRHLQVEEAINKGLFTRLLTWQSGASSGAREAENYRAAKVGIDFLRFGPFTAGDTRLNLLFAHISRGRGEQEALQIVYGMNSRQLDQALRDWVNK